MNQNAKIKFKDTLAFTLIFWFLILSIVPLSILSYNSYVTGVESLTKAAKHELKQSSSFSTKFIRDWFYYRIISIIDWSQTILNVDLMQRLEREFTKSSKPLDVFVKSDDYVQILSSLKNNISELEKEYESDYIYDLYLIDLKGNILYSIDQAKDFGTNLLHGKYANTKFSKAFKATLEDEGVHFSDLEFYEPSKITVSGFITAPLLDKNDNMIGIYAAEIKFDKIFNFLNEGINDDEVFNYYLVGQDGLLRSKINSSDEILKLKMDNKQFKLMNEKEKVVSEYLDLSDKKVFGLHQNIAILDVNWVLISEVSIGVTLASISEARYKIMIFFYITMMFVIVIALVITRQISKPLEVLLDASIDFSKGKRDIHIDIQNEGEIGALALGFNQMIDALKMSENNFKMQTLEAKMALQELNEQRFALDAHSIVAITDLKGKITFVNKKFEEISGFCKEELIGANHRIINSAYHPKEFWKEMYQHVNDGKVWHKEVCNKAKDGHIYWVDTSIVAFMDEFHKPKSYIVIRTDITKAKELELKLIKANELALEGIKAKGEFLASMSHEIRTPMNGVIGMLGLLINTKLDTTQKHQASLAQGSAKALLTLINDILDFSKIEAGKMDLEYIDFNLRNELGDFAEAIGFRAQEKGIELILDLTGVKHNIIKADPGRIRQIMSNLVGNAIKFTQDGYVLVKASLDTTNEKNARLLIEVHDTGIGIPQDKISLLFDSFSQVDSSTTRKYGGTGLGLAIVKKLANLMDGVINVESEIGKGSVFSLDIEVQLSEKASLVMPHVSIVGKKILIVDDSEVNIEVLQGQLEHWGMDVCSALCAKDALEILSKNSFDIIFLDMQMPDMDGEELGSIIRDDSKFNEMKMVMMTSLGNRGDASRYERIGFDAYFPKPTTTKDLFGALNILVDDGDSTHKSHPIITSDYLGTVQENEDVINWGDVEILLVEDNITNQIVANGLLEELNLEADVAKNGLIALEILNKNEKKYNLILMDCQMPEMDGYEASKAIRSSKAGEDYKNIVIVAMTANAMQGDREKCEAAGMDDYITKPINPEKLKNILKKYLL